MLLAAGAQEVLIPSSPPLLLHDEREMGRIDSLSLAPGTMVLAGPHLLGTCRRGEDPVRSVVDSYGQSHEIPRVWIVFHRC